MSLPEPSIDDRSYQQILNEALARIPVHNPEWTNFNESDPGVTVLQLFAFMTESLLYRANRVPERNRIKFLRLLGIPRQPAAAAQGLVTFSNPRGPLEVELLPADLEVSAGQVPFRTLDGLDVLPVEAKVYYKGKTSFSGEEKDEVDAIYEQLYGSYDEPGVDLEYYETKVLEAAASGGSLPVLDLDDTVDGCVWLAVLARKTDDLKAARSVIANKILTLGIVPALTDAQRALLPGTGTSDEIQANLVYEIPKVSATTETPTPAYQRLSATPSTNLLAEPGVVELVLPGEEELQTWGDLDPLEPGVGDFPPSLEDAATEARVITWIKIRAKEEPGAVGSRINTRVSYVGINVSRVQQRTHVSAEFLGQGTGEPDQTLSLVNVPVIADSVTVTVNGEAWTQTDDLNAADPEVPRRSLRFSPGTIEQEVDPEWSKVFTVERATGTIRFGDGLRGARPPRGAVIQAAYDYGGGLQGMVGASTINKGAMLPAGIKVSNPIPTWGGDEAESVDEAEKRISEYLKNRDRLVSEADYREITKNTPGVDIGRVEVLPLIHPEMTDYPAEGVVLLMVIPANDPAQPDAPRPDRLFLDTICAHLSPRRLVTTELHVRGPSYKPIYVSVGIDVVSGQSVPPVREAVKNTLLQFLSPLSGGFESKGWPLDRDVDALELVAVAARVSGVSKVNSVLLSDESGSETDPISIDGLQLPRVLAIAVQTGDAQPLEELRGDDIPTEDVGPKVVPIPVVPSEC